MQSCNDFIPSIQLFFYHSPISIDTLYHYHRCQNYYQLHFILLKSSAISPTRIKMTCHAIFLFCFTTFQTFQRFNKLGISHSRDSFRNLMMLVVIWYLISRSWSRQRTNYDQFLTISTSRSLPISSCKITEIQTCTGLDSL